MDVAAFIVIFTALLIITKVYGRKKYISKLREKLSIEFMDLFKKIGTIDMAISLASFRKSLPFWCVPLFTGNKKLEMQDIYHP